ncbi:hypothetical protein BDV97DRAFT_359830 [Delphinella strobiligena]|nr:hypothetical protein BDV97DRAFT_359830 [Delphinella strobiligena]
MTTTQDFQEQAPASPLNSPRLETISERDDRRSITSGLSYASSADTARRVKRRFSRSNTVKHAPSRPTWRPGAEPGIDTEKVDESVAPHLEALHTKCDITIVDFSDEGIVSVEATNDNLEDILNLKRPSSMPCRWISVNGLSWDVIKLLGKRFNLHRLAIEDLINTKTRTKVDWYSDHAFIVLTLQKLVQLHVNPNSSDPTRQCDCSRGMRTEADEGGDSPPDVEFINPWKKSFNIARKGSILPYFNPSRSDSLDKLEDDPIYPIRTLHRYESNQNTEHTAFMEEHSALSAEGLVVSVEQASIFLMSDNSVLSFFEHSAPDVEEPILERLRDTATMLRRSADASLIVQAIIDAIVDLAIPVKDAYNTARKELQIDVLTNASMKVSKALHVFQEEIDMLQNLFKPIVNLVNSLRDHTSEPIISFTTNAPATGVSRESNQSSKSGGHPRPGALQRAQTSTSVVLTPLAHIYLGDVLDHCLTIFQSLDQMDASAKNLSDLSFNTLATGTNNFMMIIALVTVFFSPLTFLTGYFGMNFARMDAVQLHSDAFFWYIAVPSTIVFIALVGGGVIYRTVASWYARLHVKKVRKAGRDRRAKIRQRE